MHDTVPSRQTILLGKSVPVLCGVLVLIATSFVLVAWLIGLDANDWVYRVFLQMKANTALCMLLLSVSLIFASRHNRIYAPVMIPLLCVLPVFFATVTLLEYRFVWDSGLSQMLSPDLHSTFYPGRMAPLTTVAILLFSLALIGQTNSRRTWIHLSQIMSFAGIVLATVTLLSYLYGASSLLHLFGHTPMAMNTAVLLFFLGVGILTLNQEYGPMAPLCGMTVSARMGRRLLTSICLALPLLAWLRMQGQAMHFYSAEFGTALVVTICLVIMSVLIVIQTFHANHAEVRLQYLNRVYSVLSEVNSLIVRASNRAELFAGAHRIAVERGAFPRAWLGIVNADSTAVELVAGHEKDDLPTARLNARLSLAHNATGASPIARAFLSGLPVVSNDVAAEDNDPFQSELLAHNIRSFAVFPLVLEGRVIGIFKLHAEVPHFFHDEEMRLLGELAGDITFAIRHLEQRQLLDHLAYFDSLTDLANARLFEERLGRAVDHAPRKNMLAVMVIDLIAFKAINEAFGRNVGDETLKEVARRMTDAGGDMSNSRLGSNLFAIYLHGVDSDIALVREIERIDDACFGRHFGILGHHFALSARTGIAILGRDGEDARTLLNNAEAALATARFTGQRYRFHDRYSNERNTERLALQTALVYGLDNQEFELHYQIKVSSKDFAICGAEALLRWNSRSLGKVEPSRFVPLLEETGLIHRIGQWALRQASIDNRQHASRLLPGCRIAVNVSTAQLMQHDFVDTVISALGEYVTMADIDLELTESLVMTDVEESINKLRRLRNLGIRIAIDDFGTGYSSMAYLAKLPLDYLKIDRSFINGLPDDQECITVISSIISLGHALGLQIIAEGIEHPAQAELLASLGCDQLQGYLFGKAVPLAEFLDKLGAPDATVMAMP